MKLSLEDTWRVRGILAACKLIGLNEVALTNVYVLGASKNLDAAIISPSYISIPPTTFVGLPRRSGLIRRLSIFKGDIAMALDVLSNNDAAHLVAPAGTLT